MADTTPPDPMTMSAELPVPPPVPIYFYYPGQSGWNPALAAMMAKGMLGSLAAGAIGGASMLAQQAALNAAMAAQSAAMQAKMAAVQAGTAVGMSAYNAAASKFGPLGMIGKYMFWRNSGKFDNPSGGDIDFYHNRLCFGEPCKFDPNNTNDLNIEWLRRAVPMRDYPFRPPRTPIQLLIPKPDREFSLIASHDPGKCPGQVHMVSGVDVKMSSLFPLSGFPSLGDFL